MSLLLLYDHFFLFYAIFLQFFKLFAMESVSMAESAERSTHTCLQNVYVPQTSRGTTVKNVRTLILQLYYM